MGTDGNRTQRTGGCNSGENVRLGIHDKSRCGEFQRYGFPKCPSKEAMRAAGWSHYPYPGRPDRVRCIHCRQNRCGWEGETVPLELHKFDKADCPFISLREPWSESSLTTIILGCSQDDRRTWGISDTETFKEQKIMANDCKCDGWHTGGIPRGRWKRQLRHDIPIYQLSQAN